MLLVAGPSPEFLKFIQILCWIVLPVFVMIVIYTVITHYRRKKNDNISEKDPDNKFLDASPEQAGYTVGNGEYVSFDLSHLIREYKDRLTYNHARYAALQRDFTTIETKYTALARYAQTHFVAPKKQTMKNLHDQMPNGVQREINKIAREEATEKSELEIKVMHLEKTCQQLEQENTSLKEQVQLVNATGEERTGIINKWKEENDTLRNKVLDFEYLEDLVEEKKAQIIFLQNQLEQRVKNLYQFEHQRLQAVTDLEKQKEENAITNKSVESLKQELSLKRDEIDKLQMTICEKEESLNEKEQLLGARTEHNTSLENVLKDFKEQNESLSASLKDSHNLAGSLHQQLADEQSKVQFLTQKLFANKQLMRKLNKELTFFINEDTEESPVIALRAEYKNMGHEEEAAGF